MTRNDIIMAEIRTHRHYRWISTFMALLCFCSACFCAWLGVPISVALFGVGFVTNVGSIERGVQFERKLKGMLEP